MVYSSITDAPALLWIKYVYDQKHLKRLEPFEAATTLGVDIAANSYNASQFQKMKEANIKWVDQIRVGKLQKDEVALPVKNRRVPLYCCENRDCV